MRRIFRNYPWREDPVDWLLLAGRSVSALAIVFVMQWTGAAAWWRMVDDQPGPWSRLFGRLFGLLVGVGVAYLVDTCARTQGERVGQYDEQERAAREARRATPPPPAPPPVKRQGGRVVLGRQTAGGPPNGRRQNPAAIPVVVSPVSPPPPGTERQAPAGEPAGVVDVRDAIVDVLDEGPPAGMTAEQLARALSDRGIGLAGRAGLRRELWRLIALEQRVRHQNGRYWSLPVTPEADPFPGLSEVLLNMVEQSGEEGLTAPDALAQLARYGVGDVPRERVSAELRRLVVDGGIGQEPGGPYLPVSVAMLRDGQEPL